MYIDKYREVIETSVTSIPERLKEIDKDYFVVRNHNTNQFEVHHSGQIGGTLALNIPYEQLDERTLQLVKETSIEYADKIFKEMEENNLKIELEQERKRKDLIDSVTREIHSYVTKYESKETIDKDSKLLQGVI